MFCIQTLKHLHLEIIHIAFHSMYKDYSEWKTILTITIQIVFKKWVSLKFTFIKPVETLIYWKFIQLS